LVRVVFEAKELLRVAVVNSSERRWTGMDVKPVVVGTESKARWEKLLCPSNCQWQVLSIEPETGEKLWEFDSEGIPAFVSAYRNTLEMVRWLAVYEPERSIPFGEEALGDLGEMLRIARDKLSYEKSRDDVPQSYEQATSECIRRLEDIHENLAALISKVASETEKTEKDEIYSLLESLHQHTVNPPVWMDYESA
jgi:hypothetical protein